MVFIACVFATLAVGIGIFLAIIAVSAGAVKGVLEAVIHNPEE